MYYIVNETNQIIAADESLLSLCGFTHINELSANITLEKLTFQTITNNQLILTQNNMHHTFSITSTSLSSLLGKLTLITLETDKQANVSNDIEDIDIDSLIIKTDTPTNTVTIIDDIEKEIEIDNSVIDKEETVFDLLPKESDTTEESALFNFMDSIDEIPKETVDTPLEITTPLPDDAFTLLDTQELVSNKEETYPTPEIIIDIEKVSKEIGVSEEDFNLFLNEYIDTALDLEQDLHNSDDERRTGAIETLLHLSEVLHLDVVDEILQNIDTSTDTTRRASVTSFYDALSRITTTKTDDVISYESPKTHIKEVPKVDDDLLLFDLGLTEDNTPKPDIKIETVIEPQIEVKPEPVQKEEKKTPVTASMTSFGEINLSEVKPIHFDFQLSAAADELSLPESLIEEFMVDFVEQAHTETDKMLLAYKKGDLETVNKIGHLLKGVSSNLRITPLSDTLYKIQFCEEPNDLENLIKDYWGHFLFFEKQINMLSN